MDCVVLSDQDKEKLFGQMNVTYMMGLRKDKAKSWAFPQLLTQGQGSIIQQQNDEKVLHYLFSLEGDSGSGISIEPAKFVVFIQVVQFFKIMLQLLMIQLLNI